MIFGGVSIGHKYKLIGSKLRKHANYWLFTFHALVLAALSACADPPQPAPEKEIVLTEPFPGPAFIQPVDFTYAPDGSKRIFIVEKPGKIIGIDTTGTPPRITAFLDITARVNSKGNEEGLLGLAFDPNFKENGNFFVYYCADPPKRNVLSRFTVDKASGIALSDSEVVVLQVDDPYSNHNGGQIVFGPDGYLYAGLGDGGSAGDPQGHGQDAGTLLGSLLRLDVSVVTKETPYKIPPDNPFVGVPGKRAEIYALGLRNPWRFSFDSKTGELWAGDVGQNRLEEIDIIVKGGNYGWNVLEGILCFKPDEGCSREGFIMPVHEYGRDLGVSVTGGFVYHGKNIPGLYGDYIFGDFATGRIWALKRDTVKGAKVRELLDSPVLISAFGVDWDGELYVLDFRGKVLKIERAMS